MTTRCRSKPRSRSPTSSGPAGKARPTTARSNPLRPIVLTHAGDGTNRVFVATQQGVIHVFPNDQKATETKVFLDIQDRVQYDDKTNEEGFLGLAFHPKYKENGEFFVFYTPNEGRRLTNVVSRFRVSKDDPNKADPASRGDPAHDRTPVLEPRRRHHLLRPGRLPLRRPSATAARPTTRTSNGQNLEHAARQDPAHRRRHARTTARTTRSRRTTRSSASKDALPEIWAYGLRNIWRMAFDRKTGKLWAGDVGQNLYEEINIIEKGGNYGWSLREGLHPFGAKGVGAEART